MKCRKSPKLRSSLKRWNLSFQTTKTKAGPYAFLCFAKCIMKYGYLLHRYITIRLDQPRVIYLSYHTLMMPQHSTLAWISFINSCLLCLDPRVEQWWVSHSSRDIRHVCPLSNINGEWSKTWLMMNGCCWMVSEGLGHGKKRVIFGWHSSLTDYGPCIRGSELWI